MRSLCRVIEFVFAIAFTTVFICNLQAQSNECPQIELRMPSGVAQVEQKVSIILKVSGDVDIEIDWSVSAGIIVQGQGTTSITVIPSAIDAGTAIKVTAKVSGLSSLCPSEFTDHFGVMQLPHWGPVDEIGKMPKNAMRGRLDVFFAELANNPSHLGLIDVYFEKKDSRKHKLDHLQTIVKHFAFRKFDLSRVRFSITDDQEFQTTKFWQYTPEARLPEEWLNSKFINGIDLMRKARTIIK